MKLLKYLREKWVDSFKDPLAGIAEVFVNPTKGEYRDALEASKASMLHSASARLAYDYNRDKMYVWRGDVLHGHVIRRVSEIDNKALRIVIDTKGKLVHVYETYKSPEEEFEIVKKAMMRVFKFAPEVKGYKVAKQ